MIRFMERTLILSCNNKIGEQVKICGWVQVKRDHGKIAFLDILDRTGVIQVFLNSDLASKGLSLRAQDVICIEGKVTKRPEKLVNPNLETGSIELQAEKIEVLSKAEELPFDMGGRELNLQLPTLLEFFHPVLLLKLLLKTLGLKWGLFRHHQSLELT